tara:strand:+ start:108 stop:746 length:639 start_codon:yes stop_codon:yes gene_type:complete
MTQIIEALLEFHKQVPSISKTGQAQYGSYADLETVLSVVTPALTANGLILTQVFEPNAEHHEGPPILVTRLIHVSGAEISSRLPMVIGKGRNVLHDFGGSVTYLKRYSALAVLGLTADMDTDGNLDDSHQAPAKEKPAAKIQNVSEAEQPLSENDRGLIRGLISELAPQQRDRLCEKFRIDFGLSKTAKVAPAITSRKHQDWMNANLGKFTG